MNQNLRRETWTVTNSADENVPNSDGNNNFNIIYPRKLESWDKG